MLYVHTSQHAQFILRLYFFYNTFTNIDIFD